MITLTSCGADLMPGGSAGVRPLSAATRRSDSACVPECGSTAGGRLTVSAAPAPGQRGLLRRIHRALLRTTDGPLRPLWRLAYAGATRVCSAYLRAGAPGAAVYAGGSVASGRPIYALADLDLAVVLPEDRTGESRARVRARWERLVRAVPGMANVIDCCV